MFFRSQFRVWLLVPLRVSVTRSLLGAVELLGSAHLGGDQRAALESSGPSSVSAERASPARLWSGKPSFQDETSASVERRSNDSSPDVRLGMDAA